MGTTVAIVIGILCFFTGLSNGIGFALLFSLAMGGMSWAAFGMKLTKTHQETKLDISSKALDMTPSLCSGYFSTALDGERITPEQYGYWLIRWSHDGAVASLETLNGHQFELSPFAKIFQNKDFWIYFNLVALFASAYWIYAKDILHVPTEVLEKMLDGKDAAVKELKTSNGETYDEELVRFFNTTFCLNLPLNKEDLDTDNRAFNPDTSAIAKRFLELISSFYPDVTNVHTTDRLQFSHFISDIPFGVYKALKEDFRISYNA